MTKTDLQLSNNKQKVDLIFFKRWNIIYRVKFYQNKKVLYLCHLIQFILALVTLSILYVKVNTNFKYGIYLSPFLLLAVLLSVFLGVYFYIYNPTFKQIFNEGQNCKIIKDRRAVLQDGTYLEDFQVLTVQFKYNGQTYQGCGCGSNKNKESIYQTNIEPFRYVSNQEMTSLNEKTMKEEDISTIKMPSWMCQPFTDYQTDIKGNGSSQNLGKLDVETCYFNFYGAKSLNLDSQGSSDYCKKSESFFQVIFKEKPYFPVDQFSLLLVFTLLAAFSFSLNWMLVIIVHYLLPCLQVEVEQDFFKLDIKNLPIQKSNKVIPTQNQSKGQSQKNQQNKTINQKKQQNEGIFDKIKNLFDSVIKQNAKTLHVQIVDPQNDQQTFQQSHANRKPSVNNSQLVENKILITQQEKDGQSNPQSVIQINNESCCDEKYTTQILQPVSFKQQNTVFFSLPPAKKKLLPPIQMNINYDEVIKENIKKEIEENKTIGNFPVKDSQKIKNQQSIDVPDLVITQNHYLHSILLKGAKKTLNQTCSQKKKSKVKFVSHNDLDKKPLQNQNSISESNFK
ncbi:hypothetical protein ABPG72_022429 [Tetrahymena utriculariae]